MTTVAVPAASNPMRPVLPNRGVAVVKSVLSGDTVVLLGRSTTPGGKPPEVLFTFERVTAPRMASKGNDNVDDPGAFPSREWLRNTVVGKSVAFETRKQGATAGDRVYGLLFFKTPTGQLNLAVESVRRGHATPKVFSEEETPDDEVPREDPHDYERQLQNAYNEAKEAGAGVHVPNPLVRLLKSAGDGFETLTLVEKCKALNNGRVKCVIEHVFDGSRYRCSITDENLQEFIYGSFTLIVAGVAAPRLGNPRLDPPTVSEPLAGEAKQFVEMRLLHRELDISLFDTDKSGACAVGTVHHPKGNIGVELLKSGLAKISDWSARMMGPHDMPAFRIAENDAKRSNKGIWHSYEAPTLSGDSEIIGVVVEVLTGDTLTVLPSSATSYVEESQLKKVSLASVRSPRVGNEKLNKPDEPYAFECKERLRILTVGKQVKVTVHYERDIPMGQTSETRQFGTISVGKRDDIGEVLVSEGLAETQRHRDDDEKSPRYDQLVAAEAAAKEAKKGKHSTNEYRRPTFNDLTEPRKAKAYSGSLFRAGPLKGVVEYVFNGSRFKMLVPSENCHIVFALENLRCPQPSPAIPGGRNSKAAEPFGDASKRHARLSVLQRTVEIVCKGVTAGGVITGQLNVGSGGQKRDYSLELVQAGLASVDQRKIDYGEAPRFLVDALTAAKHNRVGIWSLEQKIQEFKPTSSAKSKEEVKKIQMSEIKSGQNFFYQVAGDEATGVIDESMKQFTANHGTEGAPCDLRQGKIVAALFNDGTGKRWYRAKLMPGKERGKASVLFIDYGNVTLVPIATHLRPLDAELGTDRIPAVAKEGELIGIKVRPLDDDDGIDAAKMLQNLAWGKPLNARIHCECEGKSQITLYDANDESSSINEQLVAAGLARVVKGKEINNLTVRVVDDSNIVKLFNALGVGQEAARKRREGMWRYGDIGEDDEEE
mmetsp:Transcript_40687/g.49521  ORF Transcript_40687/g.49521 Transcript_40687/m.49521 type:complete len:938 (+) Transcript_40687:162-2975(+)|eukprot:CAMPEP_0172502564 /NCGR_PEP_ID=MMETSP1066-20121228/160985_1 /TAXON_ID=671091 /ORGANISM="Coscinodiscus wailesii, Strain CCMP2513" /LENGTH=937 /DNA_ID=CAMNT_0013277863 /DNA_START=150 /DNA_END=2963 /DNA_ORIENTATION=+